MEEEKLGKKKNKRRVDRLSAPSGTLLKESVCLSISATQLSAYCTVTVSCPPSSFPRVIPLSSLSLSLPHLPLLRGARSPTGVQEARLHSHPGARHLRSPVTWPEATRCNLPVRTRYHPLPIPPAGGSYTCTGGYGVQRLFFAAAKLHQLESEATAAISPFYNVSGCLPPSNLSLLFFVSNNRRASQVFRVSLTFQSFWLFEPEIPCIVVPLLPP